MTLQPTLPSIDDFFLSERLAESREVIRNLLTLKGNKPLIIQFSGGKDSMAMLGLVREVTEDFVCVYMATGLELPGVVKWVKEVCQQQGVRLLISHPGLYKGNLFKRAVRFNGWPGLVATWCCRDLKVRPERRLLREHFGKGTLYKLEGIRTAESSRRRVLYKNVGSWMIRQDSEHKGSYEVFPILRWADADVEHYLAAKHLPTTKLYEEVGVSGCALCPFYQKELIAGIMKRFPDFSIYKRAIQMEKEIGQPFVNGRIFLGDIKEAVLNNRPLPKSSDDKGHKSPCMIEWEGKLVPTCTIYGHLFLDGECWRCGEKEHAIT